MENKSYDYTTITVTREVLDRLNRVKSFLNNNRDKINELKGIFVRENGRKVRISNSRVIEFLIYVFDKYYLNKGYKE